MQYKHDGNFELKILYILLGSFSWTYLCIEFPIFPSLTLYFCSLWLASSYIPLTTWYASHFPVSNLVLLCFFLTFQPCYFYLLSHLPLGGLILPLSLLPVLSLLQLKANKTLNRCFSRTSGLSVLSASSCFGESVGLFLRCSIDLASLSSKTVNNSFQVRFLLPETFPSKQVSLSSVRKYGLVVIVVSNLLIKYKFYNRKEFLLWYNSDFATQGTK